MVLVISVIKTNLNVKIVKNNRKYCTHLKKVQKAEASSSLVLDTKEEDILACDKEGDL